MNHNDQVVTRKATANDMERLVELRKWLLSTGTGHYVAKTPDEETAWQESYRKWLLRVMDEEQDRVLVAVLHTEEDATLMACAIGIIDERAPMNGCLNGRVGWVQTVVVDPQARRRGYGERIMAHVLHWFQTNEVGKVTLQTTPMAKKLYEKLGFEASGEDLLIKEL